jgi:hypothetical protein
MKIALFAMSLAFVLLLSSQRSFACDATTESDASGGSCKNSDCGFSCPDGTGGGGQISPIVRLNFPDLFLRERKTFSINIPRSIRWGRLVVDPFVIAIRPNLSAGCLEVRSTRREDVAARSNLLSVILKGEA